MLAPGDVLYHLKLVFLPPVSVFNVT